MQQPIVIQGRTLTQSDQKPPNSPPATNLTFVVTPTDTPALRSSGKGGASVLIDSISLSCKCSGDWSTGNTFLGNGTAKIVASTPRVECEGKQMLTEGDSVVVSVPGTITNTSSGGTSTGAASVTVTITDGIQKNVDANKS